MLACRGDYKAKISARRGRFIEVKALIIYNRVREKRPYRLLLLL